MLTRNERLKLLQAGVGQIGVDGAAIGGGGSGAGRVFEGIGHAVVDRGDQVHGGAEIGIGFAGEADDEIARHHHVGPGGADALDQAQVGICRVATVHGLEDPVRSRLHRKMQVGHQLWFLGMGGDQVVGHVVGMRGRVADAGEPLDPRQFPDQTPKAPVAVRARAVVAVDVLAQERDFPHPPVDKLARLVKDAGGGPADLRAAGIGHHAEGAELVAAFLHGKEGRGAAGGGAFRQVVELVFGREIGVDGFLAFRGGLGHRGQAVVALRADHQIDQRHPAQDLFAFRLRDAAGDADLQVGVVGLDRAQAAKVGVELFRSFLADMAGVEQHHVRILGPVGRNVAFGAQRLGHAFAVVDVHLAAVGLDEELLRRGRHGGAFVWTRAEGLGPARVGAGNAALYSRCRDDAKTARARPAIRSCQAGRHGRTCEAP